MLFKTLKMLGAKQRCRCRQSSWFLLTFLLCSLTLTSASSAFSDDLDTWVSSEASKSIQGLLANVSPAGTARGAVIASPSRSNPNYYYHWVRDAAFTMDTLVTFYENSPAADKAYYSGLIFDYISFSRLNQVTPNLSGGLGEPKFNVDGSAFNLDWGRPQNDGPALRALTLIRFAEDLIAAGRQDQVRSLLYDSTLPAQTVIKSDLEYVAYHWQQTCYDLWEETKGLHFFTQMVQRKAMIEGAHLADLMNDSGAAAYYRAQAQELETQIGFHWDSNRGYLVVTLGQDGGNPNKVSGLDVAVVLGALKGDAGDGFYDAVSDRVLATALKIRQAFQNIYPVNQMQGLTTAIGRYPEDTYNGYASNGTVGNPWVLATNAYAEFYYRAAALWQQRKAITVSSLNIDFLRSLPGVETLSYSVGETLYSSDSRFQAIVSALRDGGDDFLRRTRFHAFPDGSLSEEINRYTGYMQGANDLTWNYASILTAYWGRALASESY